MKSHDKIRDEFVRQWLLKAEEDYNAAGSLLEHGVTFLSTVCFHSQQASEKFLKAFLTYHQIEFPKTHDIAELLDLIAPVDSKLSASLHDVIVLTNYGVNARYPGDFPDITISDAQEAVRMAEKVRKLVLELL
ncbi:MAG: HEPN domain-containing protein [Sedimentisphaerales bacterium]|nr:HEPN domain-containing protein [Sedimentisphaerales bacterium]